MHSLPHYQHPHQGGTFFTIDEPTLMHHYHLKPTVYITVHSWCCTFYGFGQMYNDMYPPLRYHAEWCHCPKNPCSTYSFLPPPLQLLATSDLFTVSILLPFPECHRVGIIQHVAFTDWLPSLNNLHFSSLHVFSWHENPFLFSPE